MKTFVSTTTLSLTGPLSGFMDETMYIFPRDASRFRFCGNLSTKLFQLLHHLFRSHGCGLLLLLRFPNQVHHPALLILLALPAVALVDAEHLAKELALGTAFCLGDLLHFFDDTRGNREAQDFGCTAHIHRPKLSLTLYNYLTPPVHSLSNSGGVVRAVSSACVEVHIQRDAGLEEDIGTVASCLHEPRHLLSLSSGGIRDSTVPPYTADTPRPPDSACSRRLAAAVRLSPPNSPVRIGRWRGAD